MLSENIIIASKLIAKGGHRSEEFNSIMLPQAEATIAALGHALAYTSAVDAKIPPPLIEVYECAVIRLDSAWYTEMGGLSRYDQRVREDAAISRALPKLQEYISSLGIENYVTAPIINDQKWQNWVNDLPSYVGNGIPADPTLPTSIASSRL